jgi:hypothetical protein
MTYETPYRVEHDVRQGKSVYVIHRVGDGDLCCGSDAVFMHRICTLLNDEENEKEGR